MDIKILEEVLFWSFALNYGALVIWGLMVFLAGDKIYKLHSKLIKINREQFNAIHYGAMAFYKLIIFVFLLAPFVSLKIIG